MDAISFLAPLNIKMMFIKDKVEQKNPQYLVITNIKTNGKYNIYLTSKSPNLDSDSLNIYGANLLLINYYTPPEESFSIENLTKSELLENLDKSILHESKSKSLIPELTKPPESESLTPELTKPPESEYKSLTPELTKSVMPKSKSLTPELTKPHESEYKSSIPELTKSPESEYKSLTMQDIELGASIGSSTKSSIDSRAFPRKPTSRLLTLTTSGMLYRVHTYLLTLCLGNPKFKDRWSVE